jgi:transmembrane sensor
MTAGQPPKIGARWTAIFQCRSRGFWTHRQKQRASEWIVRSESGKFTEEDRAELERWLQVQRHRAAYLRIKDAWRRTNRLRRARPFDGNVDPDLLKKFNLTLDNEDPPENDPGGSGWTFRVATAAALILINYLVGLAGWIALGPSEGIKYTTSIGGYSQITLADGTGIQLNTDSEIKARLTRDRREIRVVRGEAWFKVAHDTRRPFTVRSDNVSVRADLPGKGVAALVVRVRGPSSVDVSVTEGSVQLGASDSLIDTALGRSSDSESTLGKGEAAAVRPEGIHLAKVGIEELNRKLSWTAGLLSFQGETLSEVTDEFNRYNRKHLVVTDPSIATRRIGGAVPGQRSR